MAEYHRYMAKLNRAGCSFEGCCEDLFGMGFLRGLEGHNLRTAYPADFAEFASRIGQGEHIKDHEYAFQTGMTMGLQARQEKINKGEIVP